MPVSLDKRTSPLAARRSSGMVLYLQVVVALAENLKKLKGGLFRLVVAVLENVLGHLALYAGGEGD